MPVYRAREPRQPVRIGARLRCGRGWSNVVIRNVSSHGVMGESAVPPARGDYVEVRCGDYVIVARIAWATRDRFGARAQDRIELPELVACAQGRATARERRRQPRAVESRPARPATAIRAAASARFSRAFDFACVAIVGAAMAAMFAGAAHEALARPAEQVRGTLAGAVVP